MEFGDRRLNVRFWEKFYRDSYGCWVRKGASSYSSHGGISSHRLTYILEFGEPPTELVLDHTCNNKSCCNPYHLEPVTRSENARRGIRSASVETKKKARWK